MILRSYAHKIAHKPINICKSWKRLTSRLPKPSIGKLLSLLWTRKPFTTQAVLSEVFTSGRETNWFSLTGTIWTRVTTLSRTLMARHILSLWWRSAWTTSFGTFRSAVSDVSPSASMTILRSMLRSMRSTEASLMLRMTSNCSSSLLEARSRSTASSTLVWRRETRSPARSFLTTRTMWRPSLLWDGRSLLNRSKVVIATLLRLTRAVHTALVGLFFY